jgi:hypothetical protein
MRLEPSGGRILSRAGNNKRRNEQGEEDEYGMPMEDQSARGI